MSDERSRSRLEQRIGTVIDAKYRLVRLLGEGGMGAVFEAEHTRTGRRVAIKVMLAQHGGDHELAERFVRESRAAAKVAHPNIVDVLDAGEDATDGSLYLVQEFLTGGDLRRLLDERRALSPKEALEIIVPIASALVAAHRAGVIHRDLKPENIFLAKTAAGVTPKLIDFGIAKLSEAGAVGITRTGAAFGTPTYMSPEQARGEKSLDGGTDIWALGTILFEMLAGRCPYEADNVNAIFAAILTTEVPRIETFVPSIPKALADVIHTALERDRAQRYRTMAQFLGALLECNAFDDESWQATLRQTHRVDAAHPLIGDSYAPTMPKNPPVARPISTTLGRSAKEIPTPVRERRPKIAIPAGAAVLVIGAVAITMTIRGSRPGTNAPTVVSPPRPAASQQPATPQQPAPPPLSATFDVAITTRPPTATITLDGMIVGAGAFPRPLARDGREHTLYVEALGFVPREIHFREDQPPPSIVDLVPLPATAHSNTPRVRAGSARGPHEEVPVVVAPTQPAAAQPTPPSAPAPPRTGPNGAPLLGE